jgi:hypothetical protein
VALILISIPFLIYFGIAAQTRYLADDFCMCRTLNDYGLIESQSWWYQNWSGRYSFFAFVHALVYFGPVIVPIWVTLTVIALPLVIYKLISSLKDRMNLKKIDNRYIILASSILGLFYFSSLQSINQSLFWLSGSLTYVWPIIFFLFTLTLYVKKKNPFYILLSSLVTAGFSEQFAVVQVVIVGVFWLAEIYRSKNNKNFKNKDLINISSWVIGAFTGFIIVLLSPGNEIRTEAIKKAGVVTRPSIEYVLSHGILDAILYMLNFMAQNFGIVFSLIICGYLVAKKLLMTKNRRISTAIILIGFASFLLSIFTVSIVGTYALGGLPGERSLAIPNFLLLVALGFFGALISIAMKNYDDYTKKITAGLMSIAILFTFQAIVLAATTSFPFFREKIYSRYALKWDETYTYINGELVDNGLPGIGNTFGLTDVTPSNINETCDAFYDLDR